ncbi:HlyD family secretion protein [Roseimaritima multifibrata]|uniref:HlyD family secretion protein n=1 Tax=Roseimaritima multifibrata TaxID=1930274 RepID=A0A517MP12_9BACT|nr:HlyD family efflux transporter periplasmic adaptor subunit [Roseimaritima multifibrata]QDS96623.1 HlyD family secretion protein [Roseimaritima multifibrata]
MNLLDSQTKGHDPQVGSESSSQSLLEAIQRAAAGNANDLNAEAGLDLCGRLLNQVQPVAVRQQAADLILEYLQADIVVICSQHNGLAVQPIAAGRVAIAEALTEEITASLSEALFAARPLRGSTNEAVADSALAANGLRIALAAHHPEAGLHATFTLPLLQDDDTPIGGLQAIWFGRAQMEPNHEAFCLRIQVVLAGILGAIDRGQPSRWGQRWERWKKRLRSQRSLVVGTAIGGVIACGFLPMHYPVRANVTLQPEHSRIVAVPFDGSLKGIRVAPGDTVEAGQILVELNREEALNQWTALTAEIERIGAERSGHVAAGRQGDAELARLQAKKLQAEIDQLQLQLSQADIRSPVAGVVLGEDLQPMVGVPVTEGQTLLEIAPLTQMIAKLEIPSDQIQHVQAGQEVTMRLEAAGRQTGLKIARVAPRGELNEAGKYAFTATMTVDNSNSDLKPGMQGNATIATDRKPAAWCLLQRMWQQIRTWI